MHSNHIKTQEIDIIPYADAVKLVNQHFVDNNIVVLGSFPPSVWSREVFNMAESSRLPKHPQQFYAEWNGWKEWLGEASFLPRKDTELSDSDQEPPYVLDTPFDNNKERAQKANFNQRLKELFEYKKQYGTLNVSKDINKTLQTWVNGQRSSRKRGILTEDRIFALDSLGFKWDARIESWDDIFERLVNFKKNHGHIKVNYRAPDAKGLAHWIVRQRMSYRSGELKDKHRQKLIDIGVDLDAEIHERRDFETSLNEFKGFDQPFTDRGGINPLVKGKLRNWISAQRLLYSRGRMCHIRKKMLDDAGFVFQKEARKNKPVRRKTD